MQRWEYQVIRLNIEPPKPPPGAAQGQQESSADKADGGDAGTRRGPVFSEAYLKQEFPRFYGQSEADPSAPAQQEDAGQQLQTFLNAQGQQGWELVGLQHAGPHTFIIFKRLPAADLEAAEAQRQQLTLTLEMANRALAILEKQAQ
ncbi:MAG: hypothetical protein ACKOCM_06600 [Cyanobacteriota bacterium]